MNFAGRLLAIFRPLTSTCNNTIQQFRPISTCLLTPTHNNRFPLLATTRHLSSISHTPVKTAITTFLNKSNVLQVCNQQMMIVRPKITFSWGKGKPKPVKAVTTRFLRLSHGLWVRRQCGYKKSNWRKSQRRINRLQHHVFCNKTQSIMLDKMVTNYWKRDHHWIDDPFHKYQTRNFKQ